MADENAQGEPVEQIDTAPAEAGDGNERQYTETEQLAMEMGWKPDHQPKNGEYRTAADWIRSTDRNNKNLRRELEGMKSQVERIVDATDKQVKREVERQAKEIEARFAEAVAKADTVGAAQAAQDMRALEAEQAAQSAPKRGESAEDKFARENAWYGKDEEATAFAVAQSQILANKGVTDPDEQLRRVAEAVRKRFPEHFEGQAKRDEPKTPMLNAPSRNVRERKSFGFNDMPDTARLAANRFYEAAKMRGTAPDRKQFEANYAKDYFADQAA